MGLRGDFFVSGVERFEVAEEIVVEKPKRASQRPRRTLAPEEWTPERHPYLALRDEVAIFLNKSLSFVDQRITAARYKVRRDDGNVFIEVDSVFEDLDSLPTERPPDAPKSKGGRPRKAAAR
jgi:hypothetical protein